MLSSFSVIVSSSSDEKAGLRATTSRAASVQPFFFWDVAAVSVDDGHFPDYVDFLAGEFRKRNDFAMSKGWIKGYHILSNNNPRDGEPDLYLVTIFDHVTTPAEDIQREKEMNAFMDSLQ